MVKIAKSNDFCVNFKLCKNVWKGVHESVWKYNNWIMKLEKVLFDMQHVRNGKKTVKIAKNCVKIVSWLQENFRKLCESAARSEW